MPRFQLSPRLHSLSTRAKARLPHHRGPIGLRYALRIFAGAIVLWEIFSLFGDRAPIWAMVSMVMVSEIELHASVVATGRRVGHMAAGCAVGLIFLYVFDAGLWQLAVAAAVSSLVSFYLVQIGGNWRTAPVATVIVMGADFSPFARRAGLHGAVLRTAEVLGGCLVALAVSWAANKIWALSEEASAEVREHL
ncbi:MAG: FUSC family protein [Candidatus Acidiferrales bacterium]